MLYAQSEAGEKILPTKNGRAFCPFCNGAVIARCGEIYYHHWAHRSYKGCDEWHEPESDWHLNWKSMFPKQNVEVTITKHGKRHRADIMGNNGRIIELQHSPISTTVIRERESFYENMLWIFDWSPKQDEFEVIDQINENEFIFKWQTPKWSLAECRKPFYF
jgi:competence CoiA-like predicted nuclease